MKDEKSFFGIKKIALICYDKINKSANKGSKYLIFILTWLMLLIATIESIKATVFEFMKANDFNFALISGVKYVNIDTVSEIWQCAFMLMFLSIIVTALFLFSCLVMYFIIKKIWINKQEKELEKIIQE
ncbi:MAG: hypothetical protein Q4B14_04130 [Clostridia bacterium]|nr:hypothetical protein [Clostridia bacterium]